jgi:hypothetical protein
MFIIRTNIDNRVDVIYAYYHQTVRHIYRGEKKERELLVVHPAWVGLMFISLVG